MRRRVLRRAATVAMTVLLLTSVAAQADTVPADGDDVTSGNQGSIDLGQASPSQTDHLARPIPPHPAPA
jgi:hypothetical protein